MLYNGSDVIRDVEWVIFDEVHYINDAEVLQNCHSSLFCNGYRVRATLEGRIVLLH